MATTKLLWVAGTVAYLVLGAGVVAACSPEAEDVEEPIEGGGGTGYGVGGSSSVGGQIVLGSGGQTILVTGGTSGRVSGARQDGSVMGYLRDFPATFPDYRPRWAIVYDNPNPTPLEGKSQNLHDTAIVGDIGLAKLDADGKPAMNAPFAATGTQTTYGSDNPSCGGQPCFYWWWRDFAPQPEMTDWRKQGNLGVEYPIQLEDLDGDGVWSFDDDFFPIDGLLLNNDDAQYPEHNYGFTYELHIEFTYVQGQEFTFTGDDDVFVYINDTLAVNLGGIHSALTGTAVLDSLGLVPGSSYMLDFYFAERNPTASNFRIDTTIKPEDWVLY